MPRQPKKDVKIAVFYFLFGLLWFITNNIIKYNFPESGPLYHNLIDLFFIVLTTTLLLLFMRNYEKTKEKYFENESYLKGIYDSNPDMIIMLNRELHIIHYNKHYENNYKRLYGKEIDQTVPFYETTPSENDPDFAIVKARLAKVLSGERLELERALIYKGAVMWIHVTYSPIIDKNGFVKNIVSSISDITKSKLVLLEAQSARLKFESIYNHSTDAIFLIDFKDYSIIDCNETALRLFEIGDKQQIIGQQGAVLYNTPLSAAEQQELRRKIENNEHIELEYEYKSFKGKVFWGNFSFSSIDDDGAPLRIITISDITNRKRVEQSIIESEQKFRQIADNSPVMLWISDTDGHITFYNSAWLQFRGRTFEQETGDGWIEGVHPSDVQFFVHELYFKAHQTRTEYQVEYRLQRHDGVYRWMYESGVPLYDSSGRFEGFGGSAIDITDRKEIEKKIKESEQKFRELADSSPAMLWISDTDGKITFYNQAWLKFRGMDLDDEITHGWKEGIHPEDYNRVVYEVHAPAFRERKSYTIEYRIKRHDHQYRWILENAIPKYDSQEAFEGFFGSAVDITERKNAELMLKQQEKFNSRISELSPDNIYIYDLRLRQNIYNNKPFTQFLGYKPDEFPVFNESAFLKLIHPDDLEKIRYNDHYFRLLEEYGLVEMEYRMLAKNGEFRWIQSREIIFSYDMNGRVNQILGNIREITEKKIAEQTLIKTNNELKTANEELDSFVYRASHDLRAPLASVLGLINIINNENKNGEISKYLEMMQRSVEKLMGVIQDLIDHSRNTRMEVAQESIEFKELIYSILDGLKFHENALKINFSLQIEGENEFYSDRLRLIMLFNNLISNAIKYHDYGKETPYLKINIVKTGEKATITVEDNGIGIEQEYHEKIFNMFFRANKNSTGTGLGLYIVKGVLEKLNGNINFKSEYKKGTTFYIELPNASHLAK